MSNAKFLIIACDKCGRAPLAGQSTLDRLGARADRNYEKFGKKKAYAVVKGSCHFCDEGVYTIRAYVNFGYNSWLTDVDI